MRLWRLRYGGTTIIFYVQKGLYLIQTVRVMAVWSSQNFDSAHFVFSSFLLNFESHLFIKWTIRRENQNNRVVRDYSVVHSAYFWTLKMEATRSSETSVGSQRTTRRYIPEDDTLHNHRCDNLKSFIHIGPLKSKERERASEREGGDRMKGGGGVLTNNIFKAVKFTRHCWFVLLVKVGWREGRALGSEGGKVMGIGMFWIM
jgi:hypothetical protein